MSWFRSFASVGLLAACALMPSGAHEAHAQATPPAAPQIPDPKKSIPEVPAPPADQQGQPVPTPPNTSTDTLSDKLSRSRGVLQPPKGMDPGVVIRPPVPDPGTTRVIPPPGSPANPSPVLPK